MKHFLSLRCLNHNITTSRNTPCVTTNRHISYLSISNSLLMAANCHQLATHPKAHLKDHLKANHPRHTSRTPHRTCLNNKTRNATSPQDHLPNNPRNQDSAALTLSNQHHLTDRPLLSTSSPEASKTNHSPPNPQS
jgi:hypothetical protein